MTAPLVTVLLCVYDGEGYLREAIDSILGQTYRDFEFLIIDDASRDATPAILASYDDKRIRIIRNPENIGLTRSLNLGLREARGALIARQDADDVSFRDRLARQVAFLERNGDVAVVGSQAVSIDELGRRRARLRRCETHLGIRWQLMYENPFVHSAVVFRRDLVLDRFGGYDETFRTNQDFELWSRLSREHPLRSVHETLVANRGRSTSISSRYSMEAIRRVAEVFMSNVAATIGAEPAAAAGIDVLTRGTNPRLYPALETLEPLVRLIDSAYERFVKIWPEAAQLREIRAQSASLIARIATMAANASPATMSRWYLTAARYDLPAFAQGALRFAATSARAFSGRATLFREADEKHLKEDAK
ncbi:MAG: hypothetical protein QOC81_314 [Thermoanaerobaculia bacterium]|nr:hypothetical protein [Thermoanaerobaculia bacterium]